MKDSEEHKFVLYIYKKKCSTGAIVYVIIRLIRCNCTQKIYKFSKL